jgi:CheY-like chemotaxis protein
MQMPGMDGLSLAHAITGDPANRRLRLVLMTSMARAGHARESQAAGIAGYLTKPVRQGQLYDCLRTVMGSSPPAAAAAHPPAAIVTTHSLKEAHGLSRARILLAEDNTTNQMAAARMLEGLGYQVDVAVNGLEAVEACRRVVYAAVLMDNQMPEMDGRTATREIRQWEQSTGTPPVVIIALTADVMAGEREKSLAAGMNDYLSKPFKLGQLKETLDRWRPASITHVPNHHPVPRLPIEPVVN